MFQLFTAWVCYLHATMTDVIPQEKAPTPRDVPGAQQPRIALCKWLRARTGHSPTLNPTMSARLAECRGTDWQSHLNLLVKKLEWKNCFSKGKSSCIAAPPYPEINIV